MDQTTTLNIMNALNKKWHGTPFTEAQVKKMKPVSKLSKGDEDFNVYALQQRDVTILAWVQKSGNVLIKTQSW